MRAEVRLKERDLQGLRSVLNAWGPIGVVHDHPIAANDEYDCLRWPLVEMFRRNASRSEVAEYLRIELRDHFGLGGEATDEVLDELFAWWQTIGGTR